MRHAQTLPRSTVLVSIRNIICEMAHPATHGMSSVISKKLAFLSIYFCCLNVQIRTTKVSTFKPCFNIISIYYSIKFSKCLFWTFILVRSYDATCEKGVSTGCTVSLVYKKGPNLAVKYIQMYGEKTSVKCLVHRRKHAQKVLI